MLGAIVGDIVGSPYEFDEFAIKTVRFPLFSDRSRFTDDTVMTLAIADALLRSQGEADGADRLVIESMQAFGRRYPDVGYGGRFSFWLRMERPTPYYSWGNGSAMRVSPVAWVFDDIDDVERWAELTAAVTHNHPEGIRGAQAVASAIFHARMGWEPHQIRAYIEARFHYDLSRTCDEIRPEYRHQVASQDSVPQAITAFLEASDFEDAIRLAVSLGGDADTQAAIAGAIAEAAYGIPDQIAADAAARLDPYLTEALARFDRARGR